MFETTTEIVLETPVTVLALLPALYVTATGLWRARKALAVVFVFFAIVGLSPVFLLFVIGEATGSSVWLWLGRSMFRFETAALSVLVEMYDGALAAWLRLCMLVVEGLLSIHVLPQQLRSPAGAAVSVLPAGLWAFLLHFVGGAMLVYGLHRGRSESMMDSLLRGGGGVLLVSGLFMASLQSGPTTDGSLTVVLLMAVIGLEIGVAAVLLGVRPDFSAASDEDDQPTQSLRASVRSLFNELKRLLLNVNEKR